MTWSRGERLYHRLPEVYRRRDREQGEPLRALLAVVWFSAKIFVFMFVYIWIRGTLPRFRYDQLMAFGWKFLLPIAIINIVVTSLIVALRT